MLLPRLLLFPASSGRQHLQTAGSGKVQRFLPWGVGPVVEMQSEDCNETSSRGFHRRRRAHVESPDRGVDRAQSLIIMAEVSAGRQALEGAPLAPGTQRTWDQLQDPVRRPAVTYSVMTAFGQNRIWPKKSEFGQCVFVTAFGQTELGQNWCYRIWPNRIWPILVFLVFWPIVIVSVVVFPGCCCCSLLFFVAACWCLLVPVGGVCLCVCGGVQDFSASPLDCLLPDRPPPDRPR